MAMPNTKAGSPPVKLSDNERKLVDAMRKMGATSHGSLKSADDIMHAGKFPKGQMLNWLHELEKKAAVKKVARQKSHGYYLLIE